MSGRTNLSFDVNREIWPDVNQWAAENGFVKKEGEGSRVLFQKGKGFLVAPMMCDIRVEGSRVELECWVRANLFVRLMALFLIPSEMHIEPGGMKMAVPRKIARNAVNKLLEKLGQKQIE